MKATQQQPSCPECGKLLSRIWQFVTEQRKYVFHLPNQTYVGRSDPVDDTSHLDFLACPSCGEELPEEVSMRIQSLEDFSVSP